MRVLVGVAPPYRRPAAPLLPFPSALFLLIINSHCIRVPPAFYLLYLLILIH